jgi:DegV family protein with EDD domain
MNDQKIVVVTDSSAFIPKEALGGLSIPVIPLWITWGNERLRDGVDIDPPTLYRRLRESKTLPTTSEPSVEDFVNFFRQVATEQKADAIVAVLVSSGLSRTFSSARAAQAQLPEFTIRIVDSLSISMALGFTALAAARASAAGQSLDEVVARAEIVRSRTRFLFVVDTLEYLRRGGRVVGARWLLGTALQIKPLLHVKGGRLEPLAQVRTKSKALSAMLDAVEEQLQGKQMAEVAVCDVDNPDERDAVAEQVGKRFDVSTIYRCTLSPAVGTHGGPGTVGLAFYTER